MTEADHNNQQRPLDELFRKSWKEPYELLEAIEDLSLNTFWPNDNYHWKEFTEFYEIKIPVPGYSKNDLKVILEEDLIHILPKEKKAQSAEATFKGFSFPYPADIRINDIKARCRHGMLKIYLPKYNGKTEKRNKKSIPVKDKEPFLKTLGKKVKLLLGNKSVKD